MKHRVEPNDSTSDRILIPEPSVISKVSGYREPLFSWLAPSLYPLGTPAPEARATKRTGINSLGARKGSRSSLSYLVYVSLYLPSWDFTVQLPLVHANQNYALLVQHHLIYIVWSVLQVHYISCTYCLVGLVIHHTLIEVQAQLHLYFTHDYLLDGGRSPRLINTQVFLNDVLLSCGACRSLPLRLVGCTLPTPTHPRMSKRDALQTPHHQSMAQHT